MAFSLMTLSAADRCIVAAPNNCFEVTSQVHDFGEVVDCSARHFGGKLVLNAIKIGNDCYDVTVQNYPHIGGGLRKGKLIRFVTTGTWVGRWLATVGAKDTV
jgi:hypothetical protein